MDRRRARQLDQAWDAQDFQDLMRHRVDEILLVASPYDSFILEEDGQGLSAEPAQGLAPRMWRHPPRRHPASTTRCRC